MVLLNFVMLRFGSSYGFFKSHIKEISFIFEGEKYFLSSKFKMMLVFQKKSCLTKFFEEMNLINHNFIRVLAFEEKIDFLLKDYTLFLN